MIVLNYIHPLVISLISADEFEKLLMRLSSAP